MRTLLFAIALASGLLAQEPKHLQITTTDGALVNLSADNMQRGRSVVELKGNVEIHTRWVGEVSYRDWVMHADEAVYHVDTGEIEAHGKVTVTPAERNK